MHEAVIVLKGVLGFTDQPLTSPPRLKRIRTLPKAFAEARSRRFTSPRKSPMPSEETTRVRAFSDPFVDDRMARKVRNSSRGPAPPPPAPRRQHPLDHSDSLISHDPEEEELLLAIDDELLEEAADDDLTEDDIVAEEAELNLPRYRLWTFPTHITDQEAEDLMSLFPPSVMRRDLRLPYVPPGHGALESENEAWVAVQTADIKVPREEMESKEGVVRYGTGRIWLGTETRMRNSDGSFWFKFKRWWKRLFGMG